MNVHVNGAVRPLDAGTTVGRLVDTQVRDRRGVAVAVDGEVVPRRDWDATPLVDGARIELVGAVQGG